MVSVPRGSPETMVEQWLSAKRYVGVLVVKDFILQTTCIRKSFPSRNRTGPASSSDLAGHRGPIPTNTARARS